MELNASKIKPKHGKVHGKLAFKPRAELPLGQYRCWISDNCKIIGYAPALIDHCRRIHSRVFTEHLDGTLPHRQSWQMNYSVNNWNKAFNIPEIGLFILCFWRSEHEFKGCIVMYAGFPMASLHSYMIEIECEKMKFTYNGRIFSARACKNFVFQSEDKVFFIDHDEPLYLLLEEGLGFKCSIVIEKDNQNVIDAMNPITINNQVVPQEKKRRRRRRYRDKHHKKNEESTALKVHAQAMSDQPSAEKQYGTSGEFAPPLIICGAIQHQNTNVNEIPTVIENNGVPGLSMKYEIPLPFNPCFSQAIAPPNIPATPTLPAGLHASSGRTEELNDVTEKTNVKLLDTLHRKRCWFNGCRFIVLGRTLFEHLQTDHIHQFEEQSNGDLPYKKTWNIKYCVDKYYNHAVRIDGFLSIIHMFINKAGEFGACVIMYASHQIADSHLSHIEIECNDMKFCKPIKIVTVECPKRVIRRFRCSAFSFARHKLIYNELKKGRRFTCTVVMKNTHESAEEEIKVEEQKKEKKLKKTSMKRKRMLLNLKTSIAFRNLEIVAERERAKRNAIRQEEKEIERKRKIEELKRKRKSAIELKRLKKAAKKEKKEQIAAECKMKKEEKDGVEKIEVEQLKKKKGKKRIGTQKEEKLGDPKSSSISGNSKPEKTDGKSTFDLEDKLPPGQYRCWISDKCKIIDYHSALIGHCRKMHFDEFIELLHETSPLSKKWRIDYVSNSLNRAFHIPNIGLFILRFWRRKHNLRGCIVMYAGFPKSSLYSYKLKIECGKKILSYNGQVLCARARMDSVSKLNKQVLFIDRMKPLFSLLSGESEFKCSIVIKEKKEAVQQGGKRCKTHKCRDKIRETSGQSNTKKQFNVFEKFWPLLGKSRLTNYRDANVSQIPSIIGNNGMSVPNSSMKYGNSLPVDTYFSQKMVPLKSTFAIIVKQKDKKQMKCATIQ